MMHKEPPGVHLLLLANIKIGFPAHGWLGLTKRSRIEVPHVDYEKLSRSRMEKPSIDLYLPISLSVKL